MALVVSDSPRVSGWRPRKRLWALLGIAVIGYGAWQALHGWRERHAVLINLTDSLPNWAFLIHRTKVPARGDYIFFDPPANALVRRHFGNPTPLFGKIVYGMPGDVISHDGTDVRINGRPVAHRKARTRLGERLTPGPTGVIPNSCYYVGTPHKDGFDSRYGEIGLVCARQIFGAGVPVL